MRSRNLFGVVSFLVILARQSLPADVTAAEMLMKATATGDLKTIENLLTAGYDPNLPLRGGRTPISFAMQAGQTKVVELLLAFHADPNAPANISRFSETPLQYAVETGNVR